MKMLTPAAGVAALFGVALVLSSTKSDATNTGIAGTLDPATGTFTAEATLAPAAVSLQRTGTIIVTTSVQIDSAIPFDQPISCNVDLSAGDTSFTNNASGTSNVIRTGSSGKCTTTIHYIWELANAKTLMHVAISISTSNGTINTTGGSVPPGIVNHSASHGFSPFAVPNGARALSTTMAL